MGFTFHYWHIIFYIIYSFNKGVVEIKINFMADTKRISQPTEGSEDLGLETNDERSTGRPSAGSDTQLHLAAKGGKKKKTDINDDERVLKNSPGKQAFSTSDETDE